MKCPTLRTSLAELVVHAHPVGFRRFFTLYANALVYEYIRSVGGPYGRPPAMVRPEACLRAFT